MKNTTRIAWALACAALLATPALAMADGTASIRIEGANLDHVKRSHIKAA